MSDLESRVVRRSLRALVLAPAVLLPLVSAPAFAVPPEAWPDSEPVGALDFLLLLLVIPLGLALVISLLAVVPSMVGSQKKSQTAAWRKENEWFGGPTAGVDATGDVDPEAVEKTKGDRGGASGRW